MFALYKTISLLLMPFTFCLMLALIGLILLFANNIKWAKILMATGLLMLSIFSLQSFANFITTPLEQKFPEQAVVTKPINHIDRKSVV